ncbi:MAG TPA: hypothetical protein VM056_04260 [Terriglobales bacterium]|nr:hypothetical protein [Terriglobales bacterium]
MKKLGIGFVLGLLVGAAATFAIVKITTKDRNAAPPKSAICYPCFWEIYNPKLRADLIDFYHQYRDPDPLIMADAGYIVWRSSGMPNCEVRSAYENIARTDPSPGRRWVAQSVLAFGAADCGDDGTSWFKQAAQQAGKNGLPTESKLLQAIGEGTLKPAFAETRIDTEVAVPPQARTFILGESRIQVTAATRLGTQVERVARDWISNQVKWDFTDSNLTSPIVDYHEGAAVNKLRTHLPQLQVYPLAGAIATRRNNKWYAPDENGVFRFEILPDKMQYPTNHATGDFAWIQDTHGISVLVPQAIERKIDLVIGCGDSEGKAQAAFHLSQKGIHVFFPGDRYQDMLLGYKGNGVLLGGAPIRQAGGKVTIGDQPIRFAINERIVVMDTKMPFPIQYFDAPARYFRKLRQSAPLNLVYEEVYDENQIERILKRARKEKASVVAVRVSTTTDAYLLRLWLNSAKSNRAILFHSGLYPFAQELFIDYPTQVTFGDLKPRFE